MATGTEGSSEETTASGEAAAETTSTGPTYKVVDPGFSFTPEERIPDDETKKQPSETSDDAGDDESSDADAETEETQETASGDDEVSNEIPDELLDRAVALGYDFEDIKDVTDVKAFEREIRRAESLRSRFEGKKQESDPTAKKSEKVPEEKEPDWAKMVEDGHDPEVIALQKRNWERATAAETRVKQLEQAEAARVAQVEADRFDDALNNLGEQYEPILGKGRIGELTKSSPEAAQNRVKVFQTMAALRAGYKAQGVPVPSETELIEQAVQAQFHKQTKANARQTLKSEIKKAGSQALSRPRSGGAKVLTGPDKAAELEREFWKKFDS